jgi:predicted DNA-binding transcriptional regulator YafY
MDLEKEKIVKILYTNYRGETAVRSVIPIKIWFGKTDWHPEFQWLLEAFDIDKQAERSFAVKDIKSWFLS